MSVSSGLLLEGFVFLSGLEAGIPGIPFILFVVLGAVKPDYKIAK